MTSFMLREKNIEFQFSWVKMYGGFTKIHQFIFSAILLLINILKCWRSVERIEKKKKQRTGKISGKMDKLILCHALTNLAVNPIKYKKNIFEGRKLSFFCLDIIYNIDMFVWAVTSLPPPSSLLLLLQWELNIMTARKSCFFPP